MLKPVLTFKIKFYNADISRQKNCVYKIEHEVFKNMNIFSLTLCCHTSTEQPQIVSILPLVPHLPSFISRTSKCGEKKNNSGFYATQSTRFQHLPANYLKLAKIE